MAGQTYVLKTGIFTAVLIDAAAVILHTGSTVAVPALDPNVKGSYLVRPVGAGGTSIIVLPADFTNNYTTHNGAASGQFVRKDAVVNADIITDVNVVLASGSEIEAASLAAIENGQYIVMPASGPAIIVNPTDFAANYAAHTA